MKGGDPSQALPIRLKFYLTTVAPTGQHMTAQGNALGENDYCVTSAFSAATDSSALPGFITPRFADILSGITDAMVT